MNFLQGDDPPPVPWGDDEFTVFETIGKFGKLISATEWLAGNPCEDACGIHPLKFTVILLTITFELEWSLVVT
jgi:hypothetical protein